MPRPSTLCDEEALQMVYGGNWVTMPCSATFLPGLRVLRAAVVSPHQCRKLAL
jgi:hypothetical protein